MEDRFKFNATVTGNYRRENGEEAQVQVFLKDVTVRSGGEEVEVDYGKVKDALKEQHSELKASEFNEVMLNFENNSGVFNNCDYLRLKADKVFQCSGVESADGILLYEGDKVYNRTDGCIIRVHNGHFMVFNTRTLQCLELTSALAEKLAFRPYTCTSA